MRPGEGEKEERRGKSYEESQREEWRERKDV